jgi:DNA-binding MarR family transcriptional regulator
MSAAAVQPRPGPARPAGCTNFKLRQLLRAVARHYNAEIARAGLKGTQYSMLSNLMSVEPVRPVELAHRMGLDASTLTRNLRVMIGQGWVTQGPGGDARSRLVRTTPAGRAKRAEAQRHWKKAQLGLNALLGTEQVAALHKLVDYSLERLASEEAEQADPE